VAYGTRCDECTARFSTSVSFALRDKSTSQRRSGERICSGSVLLSICDSTKVDRRQAAITVHSVTSSAQATKVNSTIGTCNSFEFCCSLSTRQDARSGIVLVVHHASVFALHCIALRFVRRYIHLPSPFSQSSKSYHPSITLTATSFRQISTSSNPPPAHQRAPNQRFQPLRPCPLPPEQKQREPELRRERA
jgi:hypothetical protein